MKIAVRNIRTEVGVPSSEVFEIAKKRISPLIEACEIKSVSVFKKSVDTRHKVPSIVRSVLIETEKNVNNDDVLKYDAVVLEERPDPVESVIPGEEISGGRPLIVGFGPSGMFCALALAERGYRPIVIERGDSVTERAFKVSRFMQTGVLDTESNVQFGAGGAGTFSDGKLVTRINDGNVNYVLEKFVEFGAPREILSIAKPHIGTDKLLAVVSSIDARIKELGGEIRYHTKLEKINVSNGKVTSVETSDGQIECGILVLAVGNSARDIFAYLPSVGIYTVPKPFSVGVRIEHLQERLDRAVFGKYAGMKELGHAEYAMSHRIGDDCVYTFCMCPGGEVISAASEEGGIVTNGMSRYARNGKNANAALVVNVSPDNPIEFQRKLERAAFEMGGGGYKAPCITVGDFLSGKCGSEPKYVSPTYMGGSVRMSPLYALFPDRITRMLKTGINFFDRKINGFADPYAILTGVETRTSSPIRIGRNENMTAIGFDNVYPCGEGAGYAGGITSASVDGLNTALKIISRYKV